MTCAVCALLRRGSIALLAAIAAAAIVPAGAPGAGAAATEARGPVPIDSATLVECVASDLQAERSATFAGEMTAIPGTARMAVRIDVQELARGDELFHTIVAPGLGVWRPSEARVKIYKYLKQVSDLSAPARYRARVRFRWLSAAGRVIRRAELFTPACGQPASPPSAAAPSA